MDDDETPVRESDSIGIFSLETQKVELLFNFPLRSFIGEKSRSSKSSHSNVSREIENVCWRLRMLLCLVFFLT